MLFDTVELADGRKLSVNGPVGQQPAVAATTPGRKDIFGVWLLAPIPNRSTSGPQPMIQQLTAAGEKAVAVNANRNPWEVLRFRERTDGKRRNTSQAEARFVPANG